MSAMYAIAGQGGTVFQKVVVAAAIFWFLLLFVQVASLTVTVVSGSSRVLIVERQAKRYIAKIQRNPRKR
jgi:hypothetical protein